MVRHVSEERTAASERALDTVRTHTFRMTDPLAPVDLNEQHDPLVPPMVSATPHHPNLGHMARRAAPAGRDVFAGMCTAWDRSV